MNQETHWYKSYDKHSYKNRRDQPFTCGAPRPNLGLQYPRPPYTGWHTYGPHSSYPAGYPPGIQPGGYGPQPNTCGYTVPPPYNPGYEGHLLGSRCQPMPYTSDCIPGAQPGTSGGQQPPVGFGSQAPPSVSAMRPSNLYSIPPPVPGIQQSTGGFTPQTDLKVSESDSKQPLSAMTIDIFDDDDDVKFVKDEDVKDIKPLLDCIDLCDDVESSEERLNRFHYELRKQVLQKLCGTLDETDFLSGLREFKIMLENQIGDIKSTLELVQLLTRYIIFIGINYTSTVCGYVDEYLELMEDILVIFCHVVQAFIISQADKQKNRYLKRMAARIKSLVARCLLYRMDSIMHCLFKVKLSSNDFEHCMMWTDIMLYFLRNLSFKPKCKKDDLIRAFIVYQKMKTIRKKSEEDFIENIMYARLNTNIDHLRSIPILKEIIDKTLADPRYCFRDIVTRYWRWLKEERPKEIWADIEEPTTMDFPGKSDLDFSSQYVTVSSSSDSDEVTKLLEDRKSGKSLSLGKLAKQRYNPIRRNSSFPFYGDRPFDVFEGGDDINFVLEDFDDDLDDLELVPSVQDIIEIDSESDEDDVVFLEEVNAATSGDSTKPEKASPLSETMKPVASMETQVQKASVATEAQEKLKIPEENIAETTVIPDKHLEVEKDPIVPEEPMETLKTPKDSEHNKRFVEETTTIADKDTKVEEVPIVPEEPMETLKTPVDGAQDKNFVEETLTIPNKDSIVEKAPIVPEERVETLETPKESKENNNVVENSLVISDKHHEELEESKPLEEILLSPKKCKIVSSTPIESLNDGIKDKTATIASNELKDNLDASTSLELPAKSSDGHALITFDYSSDEMEQDEIATTSNQNKLTDKLEEIQNFEQIAIGSPDRPGSSASSFFNDWDIDFGDAAEVPDLLEDMKLSDDTTLNQDAEQANTETLEEPPESPVERPKSIDNHHHLSIFKKQPDFGSWHREPFKFDSSEDELDDEQNHLNNIKGDDLQAEKMLVKSDELSNSISVVADSPRRLVKLEGSLEDTMKFKTIYSGSSGEQLQISDDLLDVNIDESDKNREKNFEDKKPTEESLSSKKFNNIRFVENSEEILKRGNEMQSKVDTFLPEKPNYQTIEMTEIVSIKIEKSQCELSKVETCRVPLEELRSAVQLAVSEETQTKVKPRNLKDQDDLLLAEQTLDILKKPKESQIIQNNSLLLPEKPTISHDVEMTEMIPAKLDKIYGVQAKTEESAIAPEERIEISQATVLEKSEETQNKEKEQNSKKGQDNALLAKTALEITKKVESQNKMKNSSLVSNTCTENQEVAMTEIMQVKIENFEDNIAVAENPTVVLAKHVSATRASVLDIKEAQSKRKLQNSKIREDMEYFKRIMEICNKTKKSQNEEKNSPLLQNISTENLNVERTEIMPLRPEKVLDNHAKVEEPTVISKKHGETTQAAVPEESVKKYDTPLVIETTTELDSFEKYQGESCIVKKNTVSPDEVKITVDKSVVEKFALSLDKYEKLQNGQKESTNTKERGVEEISLGPENAMDEEESLHQEVSRVTINDTADMPNKYVENRTVEKIKIINGRVLKVSKSKSKVGNKIPTERPKKTRSAHGKHKKAKKCGFEEVSVLLGTNTEELKERLDRETPKETIAVLDEFVRENFIDDTVLKDSKEKSKMEKTSSSPENQNSRNANAETLKSAGDGIKDISFVLERNAGKSKLYLDQELPKEDKTFENSSEYLSPTLQQLLNSELTGKNQNSSESPIITEKESCCLEKTAQKPEESSLSTEPLSCGYESMDIASFEVVTANIPQQIDIKLEKNSTCSLPATGVAKEVREPSFDRNILEERLSCLQVKKSLSDENMDVPSCKSLVHNKGEDKMEEQVSQIQIKKSLFDETTDVPLVDNLSSGEDEKPGDLEPRTPSVIQNMSNNFGSFESFSSFDDSDNCDVNVDSIITEDEMEVIAEGVKFQENEGWSKTTDENVLESKKLSNECEDSQHPLEDRSIDKSRNSSSSEEVSSCAFEALDKTEVQQFFDEREKQLRMSGSSSSDSDNLTYSNTSTETLSTTTTSSSESPTSLSNHEKFMHIRDPRLTGETETARRYKCALESTPTHVAAHEWKGPVEETAVIYKKDAGQDQFVADTVAEERKVETPPKPTTPLTTEPIPQTRSLADVYTNFAKEVSVDIQEDSVTDMLNTSVINLASPNSTENVIMLQCRSILEPLKEEDDIPADATAAETQPVTFLLTPGLEFDQQQFISNTPSYEIVLPQTTPIEDDRPSLSGSQPYSPQSSPSTRVSSVATTLEEASAVLYPPLVTELYPSMIQPAPVPEIQQIQALPKPVHSTPDKSAYSPVTVASPQNLKTSPVANARNRSVTFFEEKTREIYAKEFGTDYGMRGHYDFQSKNKKRERVPKTPYSKETSEVTHPVEALAKPKKKEQPLRTYKRSVKHKRVHITAEDNDLFQNAIEGPVGKPRLNAGGLAPNMLWDESEETYRGSTISVKPESQLYRSKNENLVSILKRPKPKGEFEYQKRNDFKNYKLPESLDPSFLNSVVIKLKPSDIISKSVIESYTTDRLKQQEDEAAHVRALRRARMMELREQQIQQETGILYCIFADKWNKKDKHVFPKYSFSGSPPRKVRFKGTMHTCVNNQATPGSMAAPEASQCPATAENTSAQARVSQEVPVCPQGTTCVEQPQVPEVSKPEVQEEIPQTSRPRRRRAANTGTEAPPIKRGDIEDDHNHRNHRNGETVPEKRKRNDHPCDVLPKRGKISVRTDLMEKKPSNPDFTSIKRHNEDIDSTSKKARDKGFNGVITNGTTHHTAKTKSGRVMRKPSGRDYCDVVESTSGRRKPTYHF